MPGSYIPESAGKPVAPFRYSDCGNLATIGRKAAVADLGRFQFSGFLAWQLWSFAHLWFLVGFRNRIVVFLDWAWAYATFYRSASHYRTPRPLARASRVSGWGGQ
jgi:NADH dehydrogenase